MKDELEERHDADKIKARVEAIVAQSLLNAKQHGGDTATAAADVMCAFVLLCVGANGRPEKALAAMWDHAVATVGDLWPKGMRH